MKRGFSLIELLVAIAIILTLMSLLLAGGVALTRQAKRTQCQALLAKVATAIEAYRQDRATLPVSAAGYAAGSWTWATTANSALHTELLTTANDHRNNPRKGYLVGEIDQARFVAGTTIIDVWGHPVVFYGPPWSGPKPYPGNGSARDFELWSAGPDGRFDDLRPGTTGDPDNDNIPARAYDPSTQR